MKLSLYIEELNRLLQRYGDCDVLEEYINSNNDYHYIDSDFDPYYIDNNALNGVIIKKYTKENNY